MLPAQFGVVFGEEGFDEFWRQQLLLETFEDTPFESRCGDRPIIAAGSLAAGTGATITVLTDNCDLPAADSARYQTTEHALRTPVLFQTTPGDSGHPVLNPCQRV